MTRRIAFYLVISFFSFAISLPAILPFFHSGYFPTHDGEWAVVRLTDMFRTLRDLQFPPRYSGNLNFGYGYPLFNFAYPFPYYLGVMIHSLGISFVNTIKIIFASSVFLSAFFMFLASKSLWKNTWAGVASAILYVYFPYRMVDLYVRGSIGESISFAIIPLLFYLGIKLADKVSMLTVCGIGISLAVLIATHNIMSVFFMPIFIIFILGKIILEKKKIIKSFILSILLGFGISAFFWIPALFEKSYILLSKIPIADRNLYFVKFVQLVFPKWGYGVPTNSNGFSYQFGLMHLTIFILIILSLIYAFFKNGKKLQGYFAKNTFLMIVIVSFFVFLLFKPSAFFWKLPLLSEINYPWTLLGPIGFLVSLTAGFLCINKTTRYMALFLSVCAVLLILPYAKPEYYINKGDNYYITNDATTTSSNELMPLWVEKMPTQRLKEKAEIISGKGNLENIFFNSKQTKFSANLTSQSIVRINTIYFPGWKIYVDGKNTAISFNNEVGVMDIIIPSGVHEVKAIYGETPMRLLSDIISLLSLFGILFIAISAKSRILFRS